MNDEQTESTSQTTNKEKEGLSRRQIIQRVLALVLALGITVTIFVLQDQIKEYAIYGYPGVFLLSVVGNATLVLPTPAFIVVPAMGSILNPYLVGIAGGCGAAVGEMTGYLAGYGGRAAIENRDLYERLVPMMKKWGAWLILFLGFVPNPLFDFGGLIAGALRMRWWKFLIAAAIGKSLRFILLALFADAVVNF